MHDKFLVDRGQVYSAAFDGTGTSETLAAAATGKKIRLISLLVTTDTAGLLTVQDNTGTPVKLIGPMPVAENGGFNLVWNPRGYGDTGVGKQLDLVLGTSGTYGGLVEYQVLDT